MQKSYVVKSAINFANFGFFVRVGDVLMHDTANGNKLTVYRGGEIVKAIAQTPLGIAALLKQGFITEVSQAPHAPQKPADAPQTPRKAVPAPAKKADPRPDPKPAPRKEEAPKPRPEPKKEEPKPKPKDPEGDAV